MSQYDYAPLRTSSPITSETSYESDSQSIRTSSSSRRGSKDKEFDDWSSSDEEKGGGSLTLSTSKSKRNQKKFLKSIENFKLNKQQISIISLIFVYFLLNLTLTFYNKSVLTNFPFPYFITSIHAGTGSIGCLLLRTSGISFNKNQHQQEPERDDDENIQINQKSNHQFQKSRLKKVLIILLYSTLYASNIAISNASLNLVSVPFHQIIRSTCPIFTLCLQFFILRKSNFQIKTIFSLIFIVFGAILACFGDKINASFFGMILTFLGTILAAFKTVITNLLQGGGNKKEENENENVHDDEEKQQFLTKHNQSKSAKNQTFNYSALELLEIMSPLAFIQCLIVSFCSGELEIVFKRILFGLEGEGLDSNLLIHLIGNGITAFLLNIISFKTNKAAGPLTMTVVANFKQVFTIILAFQLYDLPINTINLIGICIALIGTAWYGFIGVMQKKEK